MTEKSFKIHWLDEKNVKLSGVLDEHADFSSLFPRFKDEVFVDLAGITAINSQGAHAWIKGVQTVSGKIHYRNLSVVITEHICYNPRLLGFNPELLSFHTLSYCESCGHEEPVLLTVGKDIKFHVEGGADLLVQIKCKNCSSQTELEPVPEDYLEYFNEVNSKDVG